MLKLLPILVLVCAMLVTPAYGRTTPVFQRSESKLTPRLEQLAVPAFALQSEATIARELSLPEQGGGSLVRSPTGMLLVSVRVRDTSAATQAALRAAGARIRHVASAYNIITALVAPKHLVALNKLNSVLSVSESLQPRTRSLLAQAVLARTTVAPTCPTGTVVSEGDTQLKAAEAREEFGVSGAGFTIGVLSDSFGLGSGTTTPEDDVASGDLPGPNNPCGNTTPVAVVAESTAGGSDEGRAMLQIVHDLAPEANLMFATAYDDMFVYADNIRKLRQAGADILVDDIVYYGEPFFQDGPVNVAIQEVVEQGAQYVTAAGNANVVDRAGRNVGSYEAAAYRPTACPALPNLLANSRPQDCHNFAPAGNADPTSGFALDAGASLTIELQWAEPWFGVETELDFYVINMATGELVAASLSSNVSNVQRPFELLSYTAPTAINIAIVIGRVHGATPRIKYVIQGSNTGLSGNGIASTEYHSGNNRVDVFGPTLGDHAATVGAISVAATRYNDGQRTERFSSNGPATHYFGPVIPVGSGSDPVVEHPAEPLSQPLVINKPDVAASNGVQTTFFNQFDSTSDRYRFFGTSAAAPHAAAIAALVSERARTQSVTPSAALLERTLENTATPMLGNSSANGAGLVNALEAVRSIKNPQLRLFVPLAHSIPTQR